MAIAFKPVAEWLLVQRASKPKEKIIAQGERGDLIAPDSSVLALPKAYVLAVGDNVPINILPGDEIVLNKYSGEDIDFGGLILTTVRWDEIRLIIKQVPDEGPDPELLGMPLEKKKCAKSRNTSKTSVSA